MRLMFSLILVFLISECVSNENVESKTVSDACIDICNAVKNSQDLSNGPCIGNPIPEYSDWVCDVAHSPRQNVDNLQENQCSYYREGKAKHFVEVDETCNLIRAL